MLSQGLAVIPTLLLGRQSSLNTAIKSLFWLPTEGLSGEKTPHLYDHSNENV